MGMVPLHYFIFKTDGLALRESLSDVTLIDFSLLRQLVIDSLIKFRLNIHSDSIHTDSHDLHMDSICPHSENSASRWMTAPHMMMDMSAMPALTMTNSYGV